MRSTQVQLFLIYWSLIGIGLAGCEIRDGDSSRKEDGQQNGNGGGAGDGAQNGGGTDTYGGVFEDHTDLPVDIPKDGASESENPIGDGDGSVVSDSGAAGDEDAVGHGGATVDSGASGDSGEPADGAMVSDGGSAGDGSDGGDADSGTQDNTGSGGCCEEHAEPGCEDLETQTCVCDKLPECCTDTWDLPCVLIVEQKYCEPGVRECVCGDAPDGWEQTQCCETQWTNFCNETAIIKCGARASC